MMPSNVIYLGNADSQPVQNPNWPRMQRVRSSGPIVKMRAPRAQREWRLNALRVIDESVSALREAITFNEGLLAGQRSQLKTLTSPEFRGSFEEVRKWMLRIENNRHFNTN